MFKKMTVLAMAVGIVAAFALPASASAEWKHKGQPLQENKTLSLTGKVKKQAGATGGYECEITTSWILKPGTTGTVEKWEIDPDGGGTPTNECQGSGALAACQFHNSVTEGLPWELHTTAGPPAQITITTAATTITSTGGFCPFQQIITTPGTIHATPDDPNAMKTVTLSGSVPGHIGGSQVQTLYSGTLHVEPPDAGTYGI